jgi:hypothetical protein
MKRVAVFVLLLLVVLPGFSWGFPDQTPMAKAPETATSMSTSTEFLERTATPTHAMDTRTPTSASTPTATSAPLIWPAPPETYSVYNQYGWEMLKYEVGLNGCGLAAAFSALDDLGYSYTDQEASKRFLVDLAFDNGYTAIYGIQPSRYAKTIRAFLGSEMLGEVGTVTVFKADTGSAGLEKIRKALLAGKAVIVDILVASETVRGGTYPFGGGGPKLPQERIRYFFAHYVRVLGFEDGGQTIVLAETLHPNHFENSDQVRVSKADFIAAWQNPELRAQYHPYYAEVVYYWMMMISPPHDPALFPQD